ncbi:hypothetical protein Avbf_16665, partial [Armadillidium vulgare]
KYLRFIKIFLTDKIAPFLVKVRTENGFVNLTRQGTSKTIEVIEGDSIDLECSSLDFLFDKLTFNYSGSIFPCDTELSSAWCSNTTNIALGNDGSYKCSDKISMTYGVFMKESKGANFMKKQLQKQNGNQTTEKPY